jgi:hypothetical protein
MICFFAKALKIYPNLACRYWQVDDSKNKKRQQLSKV